MTSRFFAPRCLTVALVLLGMNLAASAKAPKLRDLADTVANNPILTQFAKMVQASDLGTFLSSRGPFTLFVPTDAAFSKLPPGTLETLLRPENKERLQDIVLFHVVSLKKYTVHDLSTLKSVLSCEGSPATPLELKLSRTGSQLVLKAKIVHGDIKCQNGVLHEIDTVLMPPETTLPPIAAPPPPPAPATVTPLTNAAPENPLADTNAPSANPPVDTNNIPVAPIAAPEASPH